ncbi:MAG: Crp/Fnr family transcriptional regulator [Polyangia bacterium]
MSLPQVPARTTPETDTDSPKAYARMLRQCALFRGVPDSEIDELANRVSPVRYREGAVLVPQNAPGDQLLVIGSGRVKVAMYSDKGREVTLAVLRPGDVIGEMSVIDGASRSAAVVALSDVSLLSLPRDEFLLHLRRSPQTALNLLGEMAQRLRRANDNIVSLALQDVEVRLVKTLARLARDEGSINPDGSLILRRRPTQQELANMVGSSRETVSRTLAAMARQGLTVTRGRSLLLTERLLRRGQASAQA